MTIFQVYLVIFLTPKNEALINLKTFCRSVQREEGYFITTIHTNHSGEFKNKVEEFGTKMDSLKTSLHPDLLNKMG